MQYGQRTFGQLGGPVRHTAFDPVGNSPSPSCSSAAFDDKENGSAPGGPEDTPGQGTSRWVGPPCKQTDGGKAVGPGMGSGTKPPGALPHGSGVKLTKPGAPLSGLNLPNLPTLTMLMQPCQGGGPVSPPLDRGKIVFANQSPMMMPAMSLQIKPSSARFSNDRWNSFLVAWSGLHFT